MPGVYGARDSVGGRPGVTGGGVVVKVCLWPLLVRAGKKSDWLTDTGLALSPSHPSSSCWLLISSAYKATEMKATNTEYWPQHLQSMRYPSPVCCQNRADLAHAFLQLAAPVDHDCVHCRDRRRSELWMHQKCYCSSKINSSPLSAHQLLTHRNQTRGGA